MNKFRDVNLMQIFYYLETSYHKRILCARGEGIGSYNSMDIIFVEKQGSDGFTLPFFNFKKPVYL